MPDIDVNEVLTDPDFASTFSVRRQAESIGLNGRVVITPTTINDLSGTIVPEEPSDQQRTDDRQTTSRVIKIFTAFRLRALATSKQPDVVIWQGVEYTVKKLKNFTQFGQGYVEADAESMNATDPELS